MDKSSEWIIITTKRLKNKEGDREYKKRETDELKEKADLLFKDDRVDAGLNRSFSIGLYYYFCFYYNLMCVSSSHHFKPRFYNHLHRQVQVQRQINQRNNYLWMDGRTTVRGRRFARIWRPNEMIETKRDQAPDMEKLCHPSNTTDHSLFII